jgi:hypothetical protein
MVEARNSQNVLDLLASLYFFIQSFLELCNRFLESLSFLRGQPVLARHISVVLSLEL